MFEEFFRDTSPANTEELSPERIADIKAAVMKRISLQESEEKTMKKRNIFRPLMIAAAAVSASALSLVTANAATDGAVMDGINKVFTVFVNGERYSVEAKYSEYEQDGMHIGQYEMDIPNEQGDETIGYSFTIVTDGDEEIDLSILDDPDISDYIKIDLPIDADIDIDTPGEEEIAALLEQYEDGAFSWEEIGEDGTVQYNTVTITTADTEEA